MKRSNIILDPMNYTTEASYVEACRIANLPKLALSMIHVSVSKYVCAHGHRPRGWGMWAFYFDSAAEPVWIKGSMTYSEALRKAKRIAQSQRCTWIEVAT